MDEAKREIKMTQKGQQYQLELKRTETTQLLKSLTVFSNHLQNLMSETKDPDVVQPVYTEWLSRYEQLLVTYEQCQNLMTDESESETHKDWFMARSQGLQALNENAHEWFSIHPKVTLEEVRSRTSSRTSTMSSHLSAARLREEQRKAELLTRTKAFQEKKQLEAEKLKLKLKEEELEMKTELQVSDAKTKVIEELERSILEDQQLEDLIKEETTKNVDYKFRPLHISSGTFQFQQPEIPVIPNIPVLNPKAKEWVTQNVDNEPNVTEHDNSPAKTNSEAYMVARELNKPKSEIKVFEGNPMHFKSFQRQFEARIVANTDSYDERLNYLLQFTNGEAHRIANGFSHLNAKTGYDAAWAEFHERYGDPDVIAHAYVKRAINWPIVKNDNPKALDEFAIFLLECQYAVENVEAAGILEYSENLKLLVQKLPYYLHERWRNIVYDTKDKKQIVKFSQLVRFVRKEAKKVNDPVYGKDVLVSVNKRSDVKPSPTAAKGFRKNFSTHVNETSRSQRSSTHVESNRDETVEGSYKGLAFKTPCVFCNGKTHSLDACRLIIKKDLKDRYQFIKFKGLCFGCLKYGHQKIECRHRAICTNCHNQHPSIFHVEPREHQSENTATDKSEKTPINTTSTATHAHMGAGEQTSLSQALPIVPLRLKSSNSDKYVETYAFLDSGSTSTFCSEDVLRKLNVEAKHTKINLITMGQEKVVDSFLVSGLEICDLNGDNVLNLPQIFTQETLPISKKDIVTFKDLQRWEHLRDVPLEHIDADVGLLIGINVPKAMEPWDVISSVDNSPFAVKTLLGWVINGPLDVRSDSQASSMFFTSACNRIVVSPPLSLDDQLRNFYNYDFSERTIDDIQELSKQDKHFLDIASKSIEHINGHYVMDLPFRSEQVEMPNNRKQAEQRLVSLSKRFKDDSDFREQYTSFMNKVITEGHATVVTESDLTMNNAKVWYLPHHGVYHPRKKKLRVVFDCAARYGGTSLNDNLLQGPNLTNTLVGTLIRFRQGEVAFMGDIDGMFHQVRVSEKDTDFLRFLWWENGECSKQPIEYKMTVHLFGATSSPSCANYALQRTADNCKGQFSDEAVNTVLKNFYVDDCLKSLDSEREAIELVGEIQALLKQGGFRIAKWISNSRDVIRSVPLEARAKEVMDLDLEQDNLPVDRALGIQWLVDSDDFSFKVEMKDKPISRRGILSLVSSVFDPLGFLAPFTFVGKRILQDCCRLGIAWDDQIPKLYSDKWIEWLKELEKLSEFRVNRCLKPTNFGKIIVAELHHFADASEIGYGTVTYLRMENELGDIHCSFLLGKARVAPLKQVTIPRLELTAATVAVRTNKMIISELEIPIQQSYYWTDSMSVLRYIRNNTSRFHTFVANRLAIIHEGSDSSYWHYINTKLNPADTASRGITANDLIEGRQWISPPEFLWKPKTSWSISQDVDLSDDDTDLEIKKVSTRAAVVSRKDTESDFEMCMDNLINAQSSWYSLKRKIVWILRLRKELLRRVHRRTLNMKMNEGDSKIGIKPIGVEEMAEAEISILSFVQRKSYYEEIVNLQEGSSVKQKSRIRSLDPILERDGLIRVGGRLHYSSLPSDIKHPIILPKSHHVSNLILRQIHEDVGHSGRNHMLSSLRQKYWIINAPSAIRNLLSKCVICRKWNSRVGEQKMADLPEDRVVPNEPPFTRVGVDYFGPFEVKFRRSRVKRYGVIFTCLASRAIHLEVAASLDTDSYINALRRFIARRGQVQKMRSDNGTNFVGAEHELAACINEWNLNQIQESMLQKQIDWQFNPPAGSHHGGVWERLIRSVRKVMNSILKEQVLDDEGLQTLMCEVESILNSRPITRNTDSHRDLEPLTPNHLLTMKQKPILPPGLFVDTDSYGRRRWRQVQYMSNLFWSRWTHEYLPLLQERQKWHDVKRNLKSGDVVLIVDSNAPRNAWPMGVILETIPDKKGLVRQVKVKTATNVLKRPVDKLCLILECD